MIMTTLTQEDQRLGAISEQRHKDIDKSLDSWYEIYYQSFRESFERRRSMSENIYQHKEYTMGVAITTCDFVKALPKTFGPYTRDGIQRYRNYHRNIPNGVDVLEARYKTIINQMARITYTPLFG
jgi:hypothetical protein